MIKFDDSLIYIYRENQKKNLNKIYELKFLIKNVFKMLIIF